MAQRVIRTILAMGALFTILFSGCENTFLKAIQEEVALYSEGTPDLLVHIDGDYFDSGDEYDFGDEVVDNHQSITIYLENNGTGDVVLTGSTGFVSLSNGTAYSTVQPGDGTIVPGPGTSFDLTFSPDSVETYSDLLTIEHNGDDSPYVLNLTGQGTVSGTVSAPTFSPGGQTYNASQQVTISTSTTGATIRYTTNGTTPTETHGTVYSTAVTVSESLTVRAVAYRTGWATSSVGSAIYTLKAQSPIISPSAGTWYGGTSVSLTNQTSGAVIRYTTDGTAPTGSSTVYSSPFSVDERTTVRAIAIKSGWTSSDIAQAIYTIPFSNIQELGVVANWPVDMDGSYVIAGAMNEGTGGRVYIYQRTGDNTWSTPEILNSPNPESGGKFGFSVAIDGDYAAVGAPYENTAKGRVYIYKRTSGNIWALMDTITSTAAVGDNEFFGWSVDLCFYPAAYIYVAVGAPYEGLDDDAQAGAVYRITYWDESRTDFDRVEATNKQWYAHFGQSVGINSGRVLGGAPGEGTTGAAYRFSVGNPTSVTRIVPPDGGADDDFGSVVAMGDTWGLIASPYHDLPGKTNAGAVYTYNNQWFTAGDKLTASDSGTNDSFGLSLASSGNRIVIGASYDDVSSLINSGSAYVFDYSSSWTQRSKLSAETPTQSALFGTGVAVDGDYVIIVETGSAYSYW